MHDVIIREIEARLMDSYRADKAKTQALLKRQAEKMKAEIASKNKVAQKQLTQHVSFAQHFFSTWYLIVYFI